MASTPETGFLVIANLTGYTAYLSRSEIEHAPAIAGDLLETIVGRLDPPFRLAKFEGDAAFLVVEDGRADGSLLLDAVEASYLAFRRRLRDRVRDLATARCRSCLDSTSAFRPSRPVPAKQHRRPRQPPQPR
jgi:hypothetical protein